MNPDNKRELQFKRERDAVADSVDKFHKGLKTAPEHSRPGSALLQEYWKSLADAISGEQRNLKQTSHSAKYAILMLGIEANSLAVITLQSIIWARGFDEAEDDDETAENEADDENEAQAAQVKKKEAKLTRLTKEIARRSRYHWWRMTEAAKNEALGRCTEKYSAKIQNRERRKAAEILNGDWSRQARDIPFGARLLELATEAGIITITREFAGKNNNPYVVEFTDKFKQSLEKSKAHYEELLGPIYRPMVCEPVKWVGPEGGGYLENEDSKEIHLVKHRKDQRLIRAFRKG